jgi:outer membrane lipoprotein-sorting protein
MHFSKKILCLIILIFPFCASAQTADDVIKRYVAFIGGKSNWKNVKTLKTSGEYDYGGIKFPFTTYAKAPNLYKYVVTSDGKSYVQSYDGAEGWKLDGFENQTSPKILTGNDARQMANESDVELASAFIDYKRKGHTATLEGKEKVNDANCFVVKLTRQNGDVETYWFDGHSGALMVKAAKSKNPEMQGAILTTTYSDYREVDGVKIAFKSVSKSNDQIILEVTVSKAEVNTPIDDSEFKFKK